MTNELTDTYKDWVTRVAGDRSGRPLSEGETVEAASPTPFETIDFSTTHIGNIKVEMGTKGDDFIFHFFPDKGEFPYDFEDKLGSVFTHVFKDETRLVAGYSKELNSWAIKAAGYAQNPLAEDLLQRVLEELKMGVTS